MIQCPCQVKYFCSIKRSPLNFLNICGAVTSQTVPQALLVIAVLSTAVLSLTKHASVRTCNNHCSDQNSISSSLRMTLALCFCYAHIKWTEGEQTLKYVVAYQKHLAKLQVFVSFCNRVRNVVCSKFGIWLKETSVVAASTSADSETKYITDIISPWTYGFAFLQSS